MEGEEVWVVTTHTGWGEGAAVQGVYVSREAAWDGLKDEPNMTIYVDEHGILHGRPRNESQMVAQWAQARPMKIRGRKAVTTPSR